VWSWGAGKFGMLGVGHNKDVAHPVSVAFPSAKKDSRSERKHSIGGQNIVDIAGGAFHSVAVSEDGGVWTWGLNKHGQLGVPDDDMRMLPVSVSPSHFVRSRSSKPQSDAAAVSSSTASPEPETIDRIVRVFAGSLHSCALSTSGVLFTWGNGVYGELGHGKFAVQRTPQAVEFFVEKGISISGVACGKHHTIVLEGKPSGRPQPRRTLANSDDSQNSRSSASFSQLPSADGSGRRPIEPKSKPPPPGMLASLIGFCTGTRKPKAR